MEYSDNPRKVYGRVDIIYSDSQINDDIVPASNSLAQISHPEEVFKGYLLPTLKACVMDGNALMDGTFQMLDESCVVGWWSKSRCNENGNFLGTKPYLELSFVQRPVISWLILGDVKLNQYPVDFTITYYTDDVEIMTENITDNNNIEVKLEPRIDDITRIRLTIAKWNTPNACAKILKFYDRLYESYQGDAIEMFEVSEELGSVELNYNITSDVMTVSIYNHNRKFDKGYLRTLMMLDRKLIPYIGIEKDGFIEYTKLGTFYSDEWQISQDSQWVKCSATDNLMRLQNKTYIGFPFTENVSIKEIAEDIVTCLGLNSDEYIISESLTDVIIPRAYMPKCSYWDALQEIANSALCRIYVDRLDRIVIANEDGTVKQSDVNISSENMFSASSNISLTEFANEVKVEYSEVLVSEDIMTVAQTQITLTGLESVVLSLDFSSEIADAFVESSNPYIKISNIKSGVNAGEVTVANTNTQNQTAIIKVTGNAISANTMTVKARDEDSIKQFGVTEYSHPTTGFVQSYEHANAIAFKLLQKLRPGEGVVTAVWRGDCKLDLTDEYTYADRFGDNKQLVCEHNRFVYNGGFRQETRGRKK
jgi:hypothetical protein